MNFPWSLRTVVRRAIWSLRKLPFKVFQQIQGWFLLGNHNHQANPHIHQQHIVWATTFRSALPQPSSSQIWLDKGWGNPNRNVVARTICCWRMCGFAWWLFQQIRLRNDNDKTRFGTDWFYSISYLTISCRLRPHDMFQNTLNGDTARIRQLVWTYVNNALRLRRKTKQCSFESYFLG